MRWLRVLPLLCAVPLLMASSCPLTLDTGESDAGVGDGGAGSDAGLPPLRDVTFGSLAPGDFSQTTVNGVTLTPSAYQGGQSVTVEDRFGEGQDLMLGCGTVTAIAPELHQSFQLVFNDDNGTILVSIFDQNGQLLTDRPIDTRGDAAAVGIVDVDQVYKKLVGAMAAGSDRRIGRMELASCAGGLHEIVLQ